jgi:hypothetical protein
MPKNQSYHANYMPNEDIFFVLVLHISSSVVKSASLECECMWLRSISYDFFYHRCYLEYMGCEMA